MSENQVAEIASTGIKWDRVLQENQDNKNMVVFQEAIFGSLATWELAKMKSPDLKDYEEEGVELSMMTSIVISDCLDASGLTDVPMVILDFDMKENQMGSIVKDNDKWILALNGNAYATALKELRQPNQGKQGIIRVLWAIAHEIGHERQIEKLGMKHGISQEQIPDKVIEIVGEQAASVANYVSDVKETNANGFATRYFATKHNDPNAAPVWKGLDFSGVAKEEWEKIGKFGIIQKAIQMQKMLDAYEGSTDIKLRDDLQRRAQIFVKSFNTWQQRLDKAAEIIGKRFS